MSSRILFDQRLRQSTRSRYVFSATSVLAVLVLRCFLPQYAALLDFFWINGLVVLALLLAIQGVLYLRRLPPTLILEFVAVIDLVDLFVVDGFTRVHLGVSFTPIFILGLVNLGSGYLFYFFCYEGKALQRRNLALNLLFLALVIGEDLLLWHAWGNVQPIFSLLKVISVYALYAFLIRFVYFTVTSLREQASQNQVLNDRLVGNLRFVVSGELFTSILHDLKNNLQTVFMAVDFLKISRDSPEKQAFAVQAVESELERVRRITEEFLGYVRMEHIERTPLCVAEVLRKSVDFLGVSRKKIPPVRLQVPAELESTLVLASRYRLFSVFLNLLDNAVHSLEHSAQAGEKGIIAEMGLVGNELRVRISDNGPGIPPEHLATLFDMKTTKKEGSGIGLFLTRDYVVNKLGGRLEVTSVPFQATCFDIALPVCETAFPQPTLRTPGPRSTRPASP